jgi:hypothetical protein
MEADRMTPGAEDEAWLAIDDRSPSVDLPEELVQFVKPELQPGERLLWASKAHFPPHPIKFGPLEKAATLAITLLLATVAELGTLYLVDLGLAPSCLSDPDHEVAFFWSVLLYLATGLAGSTLAFGTLLMWASRAVDLRRLRRRIYALTDRRAIIWYAEAGSAPVSLPCETIESKYFKSVQYPHGYESVLLRRLDREPCGFLGVADAHLVVGLVRRHLLAGRMKDHS